jgi:hypothetical protein
MSKLVINTQYKENYNCTGEGDPYWKFKGGSEYIVSIPEGMSIVHLINEVAPLIEYANEMSEEFILGHLVVEDNYLSEFEKSQIECEGYAGYSEPRLVKIDGVWKKVTAFAGSGGNWIHRWTIKEGNECSEFEELMTARDDAGVFTSTFNTQHHDKAEDISFWFEEGGSDLREELPVWGIDPNAEHFETCRVLGINNLAYGI